MLFDCPPYGGFISEARAQGAKSPPLENASEQRAHREVALLLRKDAPAGLSVAALARAINDERGSNADLKRLAPGAVASSALMYRAPTTFELTLNQKFPDDPLARLFRYVVVEYKDQNVRDNNAGVKSCNIAFLDL